MAAASTVENDTQLSGNFGQITSHLDTLNDAHGLLDLIGIITCRSLPTDSMHCHSCQDYHACGVSEILL